MAGQLLVLDSDQPMKRKISEKGHGSQEGSLLGKETIFLISEAGDSPTPGSPTWLKLYLGPKTRPHRP